VSDRIEVFKPALSQPFAAPVARLSNDNRINTAHPLNIGASDGMSTGGGHGSTATVN